MAIEPTYQSIENERENGDKGGSFARFIHPNPLFYKYYWWVFHSKSPIEGQAFLTEDYRLCSAAAKQLRGQLKEANEPYWLYNRKFPRLDPINAPFDRFSEKWINADWAPSFEDDTDPIVQWGDVWIK